MLAHYGLRPQQVLAELARRAGTSGIEEQAARKAQGRGEAAAMTEVEDHERKLHLLPHRPRRDSEPQGLRGRRSSSFSTTSIRPRRCTC
jgi:hypothetical protein